MKRFYTQVSIESREPGWQVTLDGRGVRTPGKRPQTVPTRALADALAAEWATQGEEIDPASFVLRDIADYAIDVVTNERAETKRSLMRYAETDTLCYRAQEGEALHRRQIAVWEPMLRAAEARWDVRFERVSGILHRAQPVETLARFEKALEAQDDFALAALKTLASLSASLVVGLAGLSPEADPEALWQAANLEEDYQAELWGKDAEAEARRAQRFRDFAGAMRFAALARDGRANTGEAP